MLFVEKGMRYARNMVQDNFESHHFEQNVLFLRKFKHEYLLFIRKHDLNSHNDTYVIQSTSKSKHQIKFVRPSLFLGSPAAADQVVSGPYRGRPRRKL